MSLRSPHSYGNFSHLPLFVNLRDSPPPKLILGKISSFYLYLFSKFARPLHGSEERALRHLTKRSFSPDRVCLLDLEKLRAPLYRDLKSFELLYRPLLGLKRISRSSIGMSSWTWKNSEPSLSKRGASRRDMKHDLHFLASPLNTFPYSDEKSPSRRRLVSLVIFSIILMLVTFCS